jgi:beta-xylosidase
MTAISALVLAACNKDGGDDIVKPTHDALDSYQAPAYPDNYSSMASWESRSRWNLANVHDPTVMLADDGYFYMYQTDASYGNTHEGHGHFHARRSVNLVDWEYLGGTMAAAPDWVKTRLNDYRAVQGLPPIDNPSYGYWAPVVRNLGNGIYRMYYCIVVDNYIKTGQPNTEANWDGSWTERAFTGMAETNDPASNIWTDKGFVVCSASDKGMNDWARSSRNDWNAWFLYNAIDPTYVITPEGEHLLAYGSWHSGIVALRVDPATGMPLQELGAPWNISEASAYGKRIASRDASRWQGSEAAEIVYNPETGYYYLFVAYDELTVAYNTRVGRSRNVDGPYTGIDGTDVSEGGNLLPVVTHPYKFTNSNGWVGLSHCAVFSDGNGRWFYASQGRLPHGAPGINASNAIMMGHIRAIHWTSDGWPLVMPERYGDVPSIPITESELAGNWEHIDLGYVYGSQKEAALMTLTADHMITSGAWNGHLWSYDEATQTLTVNGVKLYLSRETDWEASPRRHTIVYAGYTTTKTYWGKKK